MIHPLVNIREEIIKSEKGTGKEDEYRREIQDLFRDYRHPWDIVTELVQNSVDAINQNDKIEKGKIKIIINPKDRIVSIHDNGIGISADDIKKVLVPNFSKNKSSGKTYGYKGVGLSFVSHLTRDFVIESVCKGKKVKYRIKNSLDWVVGRSNADVKDEIEEPKDDNGNSGTYVSLTLDGKYSDTDLRTLQSLDNFFDWASKKEVVEYVLRTRTAIGNTKKYFNQTPQKDIEVVLEISGHDPIGIEYSHLTPFSSNYSERNRYLLTTKIGKQQDYQSIYKDSSKKDSDKVFRCLRHDIKDLKVGTKVITKFDLSILVCGETGVSELEREFEVNGLDESIRHSFRAGTGVYLSINGMPTGIKLHQWTDGFNKRFLCLVDVGMDTNTELDKGRKGISEYTKNLIINKIEDELSNKIIDGRYSIRRIAHRMKDSQTKGYAGSDISEHIKKWDETKSIISSLCLNKVPLDENGVILIFFQLIGMGKLHGYQIRYISQDATFDFAFTFLINESRLDDWEFSVSKGFIDQLDYDYKDNNSTLKGSRGVDYHIGEFKVSGEDIVGRENQPLSELDLLVIWDFDEDQTIKKGGNFQRMIADNRKYEGVTHTLNDDLGSCQVICLKTLLEEFKFLNL